jgi:hypothetical protein
VVEQGVRSTGTVLIENGLRVGSISLSPQMNHVSIHAKALDDVNVIN